MNKSQRVSKIVGTVGTIIMSTLNFAHVFTNLPAALRVLNVFKNKVLKEANLNFLIHYIIRLSDQKIKHYFWSTAYDIIVFSKKKLQNNGSKKSLRPCHIYSCFQFFVNTFWYFLKFYWQISSKKNTLHIRLNSIIDVFIGKIKIVRVIKNPKERYHSFWKEIVY